MQPANLKFISGNIFTSKRQTLVNTVNCVGVMGAGVALEFKFRYPEMFKEYVQRCREGELVIGTLWLYKPKDGSRWVLNFPTKKHWRHPSREEYLERGLSNFLDVYKGYGLESVAFPLLGAANGGIPEERSKAIMTRYLSECDIPIDIYTYNPEAKDDLYDSFKAKFSSTDDEQLSRATKLRRGRVSLVRQSLNRPEIRSISRLATVRGIGAASLEKLFRYLVPNRGLHNSDHFEAEQRELDLDHPL